MKISIPKDELQKNINLASGWYKVVFEKMEAKPSSDKQSTNFIATFRFECDGRAMDHGFNSKMIRLMQPFIDVIRGKKLEIVNGVVQEDIDFEPENFYNTKLQIKLEDEPYQGRMISKVKDFLPYDADTSVSFAV